MLLRNPHTPWIMSRMKPMIRPPILTVPQWRSRSSQWNMSQTRDLVQMVNGSADGLNYSVFVVLPYRNVYEALRPLGWATSNHVGYFPYRVESRPGIADHSVLYLAFDTEHVSHGVPFLFIVCYRLVPRTGGTCLRFARMFQRCA